MYFRMRKSKYGGVVSEKHTNGYGLTKHVPNSKLGSLFWAWRKVVDFDSMISSHDSLRLHKYMLQIIGVGTF